MELFVYVAVVVIVLALAIWLIGILPFPLMVNRILMALAILAAIIAICRRAGLF